METPIDEIKKRMDIVDYIGSFVNLKKTGRNFKGLCPFHQEKTPSFVVSPERQIWHCFGACGDGGDVITFLMKWENITFIEAAKELADKLGIKLKQSQFEDQAWKQKEKLITINNLAKEFFSYLLQKNDLGKKTAQYLAKRGVRPNIIKKFELGYAPSSWNSLFNFLTKKKYTQKDIYEAGLIVRSEKGNYYDRFRGRLIFPIKDTRGNVIAFSGRLIEEGLKEAKYINTPETSIYHKRENLFGLHLAKEAIKKEKNVILVEGEFDVISPYQEGIENIVAIKGSAVTKEQLMIVKRYTNRINLSLDTDMAGEEAIKRAIEEAEKLELEIGVIVFDYAKDPDEAIKKDIGQFKKTIRSPLPFHDFIINFFQKKYPNKDIFSKKNIAEGVVPFITTIQNPIVKSFYIKKLSEVLEVTEESINSLIKKQWQKEKNKSSFKKILVSKNDQKRETLLQKYLISLILQSEKPESLFKEILNVLVIEDFNFIPCQKIFSFLFKSKENIGQWDKLPAELKPIFNELYLFASVDFDFQNQTIDKIILEIKRFSLKNQIKAILTKDASSDNKKKTEQELLSLHKKLKELEKNIIKL